MYPNVGAIIHYALVRPVMRGKGVMNYSPYILTICINLLDRIIGPYHCLVAI